MTSDTFLFGDYHPYSYGKGEGRPKSFFRSSAPLSLWFQAVESSKIESQMCCYQDMRGSGHPEALSKRLLLSQGPVPCPRLIAWPVKRNQYRLTSFSA